MTGTTIPLEKETQNTICEWLQYHKYFFWRSNNIGVFGRGNNGKMSFRNMPKYSRKGVPDIIIIHKSKFIGIEVKRQKNFNISEDQKLFCEHTIQNGGHYYIVHTLEQFMGIPELY